MASPSVSIIVPAYNAARTLRACLASIQAADYDGRREIIVVDDQSSDETCAIATRLGARLIRMDHNGGPALARNAGAKAASGEILIFVDADTEMLPDSIRAAVTALEEDGVGAVHGMYEAEPVNRGFFPAYYAYLKYHAFTKSEADRTISFGAQCGAIHRHLYDSLGGYRPIRWGVDVENDEFGYRINQHADVALCRDFRVRHNFGNFRKVMYIFTNRIYWWMLFRHYCKRDESVLMTRGFGYATAALPAAILCILAAMLLTAQPWQLFLKAGAVLGGVCYVSAYAGFWWFCTRRRGPIFGLAAAVASAFFACVITTSAAVGYLAVARSILLRRPMPFAVESVTVT